MARPSLDTLEKLFEQALRLPASERAAFVSACSADDAVRIELQSLLEAAEEGGSFLEGFAAHLGAAAVLEEEKAKSHLPPRSDLRLAQLVNQYRIEELLGAGGMGVVYRAVDTRLGREVALKFLPSHLSADQRARERFLAEARAAAALNHPNVCALHEIGEDAGGHVYIAMGYYGGQTLDRVLQEEPLSNERALGWARQIASALEAAHARGIVHRDIKPGNILITAGGSVRLLDFGLAKLGDVSLTGTGGRLGTVAYMSPEQTRGGNVGAETDLWSLGVVLYEMLTGQRPFGGGNAAVTLEAIREGRPAPPSALRDDLPADLEELVTGLLSPDPAARRRPFRALLGEVEGVGLLAARSPGHWLREAVAGGLRGRWRRAALATGSAAVVVAAGILLHGRLAGSYVPSVRRLALLPLADSTADPEQHFVVEGLHQAMIEDLTRSGAVAVTSADAVERYRNRDRTPVQIARELGVDAVVQGTVWKTGDSLEVELRLLQGNSGGEVWSGRFAGSVHGGILALPSRVSTRIAGALGVERSDSALADAATAGGRDPGAERAYLRGLYEFRRFKNMDPVTRARAAKRSEYLRAAIADLEEAVKLAPEWAVAHARLALAYDWRASGPLESDTSHFWDLSKAEALRAVGLDESEAQGFASLGYVLYSHEYEWGRAERAIRRAVDLEPSSDNHWVYALYLRDAARYDESIQQFEEAEKWDPISPVLKWHLAGTYTCAGRYQEAVTSYRERIEEGAEPGIDGARLGMAYAYSQVGRHRDAMEVLRRAIALSDSAPVDVAALAFIQARAGKIGEARALLRRLDETSVGWDLTAFDAPAALAAVGQHERAVSLYQREFEKRPRDFLNMRCRWSYPYLRDDPRVREIERRMNFPAVSSAETSPPA